jgi:hypothetical protein
VAYRWPAGTTFKRMELEGEERSGPVCHRYRHVCDPRYHALWTFEGPTQGVNRLVRCPDTSCQSRGRTFSPAPALSISMPRWCMGGDVLGWLGQRRFARHWSVPQRRLELQDTHQIVLCADAIDHSIGLSQTLLAARQQAPARLPEAYREIASLVLTIDGLHPAKGPETVYGVRALTSKRGWFAEPLLASADPAGRRLSVLARQWAERVAQPVRGWRSAKQDAFVKAIAEECSGPPPRYCHTHFMRDLAKPGLERESRAKGKRRRQVRGLRAIARRVLEERRPTTPEPTAQPERSKTAAMPRAEPPAVAAPPRAAPPEPCTSSARGGRRPDGALDAAGLREAGEAEGEGEVGEVGLGYCAAGRGMLNDRQGGPLPPPGLRRREARQDVRDALDRSRQGTTGGLQSRC